MNSRRISALRNGWRKGDKLVENLAQRQVQWSEAVKMKKGGRRSKYHDSMDIDLVDLVRGEASNTTKIYFSDEGENRR